MGTQNIEALTFDVGGTVFDWQTAVRTELTAICDERGVNIDVPQFALDWRRHFFEILGEVRHGDRDHAGADALQLASVRDVAQDYAELPLDDNDFDRLCAVWHRMSCWEDFPAALTRLRKRYKVVVLTVMSFSIIMDSSRHSGIAWDGILSGEFMNHYKTDTAAYLEGASLMRVKPENIMMVAAHPFDLRASMTAGFRTAFVAPKLNEPGGFDDKDTADFDIQATDFTDLADQLTA